MQNRSIIVVERSSLAHAARLCTEQINWSTPTATYHSHLHKRVRVRARVSCVNFVITWVLATVRSTPAISHHPSGRAALSKRPGRFRRALVMCASAMKCKQAQYYSLFVGFTRTGLCRCWGRAELNAARDGSICSTTRKRPRRN